MRAATILQTGLRLLYPPSCLTCEAMVDREGALCGACWREAPFIGRPPCHGCGAPLAVDHAENGELCDECLRIDRPWSAGRAALVYRGTGRKLVLALKYGDRMDVAGPAAGWMAQVARDIAVPGMLVCAVPLHWRRRVERRYNQSVLLARGVARHLALDHCPDLLLRPAATPILDGKSVTERFQALEAALTINPKRQALVQGRAVVVVDDVMTSGATFSAATHALLSSGAAQVSVLTLARAVKET